MCTYWAIDPQTGGSKMSRHIPKPVSVKIPLSILLPYQPVISLRLSDIVCIPLSSYSAKKKYMIGVRNELEIPLKFFNIFNWTASKK